MWAVPPFARVAEGTQASSLRYIRGVRKCPNSSWPLPPDAESKNNLGIARITMKYQPDSILAIDASPFGQSLALLPALQAIRTEAAGTRITIASSTGLCEIGSWSGLADKTIDLGVIKQSHQAAGKAVRRFLNLQRKTAREEFDLVLDFSPRIETQVFSRLGLRSRTISPETGLLDIFDALLGRHQSPRSRESAASSIL